MPVLQIRERIPLRDRAAFALLLNELRDQTRPAGLMTGAKSSAGVSVKVFVEPVEIPIVLGPKGITARAFERAFAVSIPEPEPDEPV